MAYASVNGRSIHYEVFGEHGSWVSLSPGSRRGYAELVELAKLMAREGHRLLLHDRANCGTSGVAFEPSPSEHELWADDLHALTRHLGISSLAVGGSSSGARMAVAFAKKHPDATNSLLLWRLTGGKVAAERLVKKYYRDLQDIVDAGGMKALADSEHFEPAIRHDPANRAYIENMDPARFHDVMGAWSAALARDGDQPMLGATTEQLRKLSVPVCLIAGNDVVHDPAAARAVSQLLPDCEFHGDIVPPREGGELLDTWNEAEWEAAIPAMARIFTSFLSRQG